MHQGQARPVTPKVKRGDSGRVFALYDHDIHVKKRMRFAVVVEDLGEVFAGNIQRVGQIVVTRRNNQLTGAIVIDPAEAIGRRNLKIVVTPGHRLHPLVLADIEMIVLGDLAVVFERLLPGGFLPGGAERNIADFQQFGGSEERHVGRIVVDRIDYASLVDGYGLEASPLGLDGAGQSGRTGADYDNVGRSIGLALALRTRKGIGNLLARTGNLFGHQIVVSAETVGWPWELTILACRERSVAWGGYSCPPLLKPTLFRQNCTRRQRKALGYKITSRQSNGI